MFMIKIKVGFVATHDPMSFCQAYPQKLKDLAARLGFELVIAANHLSSAADAGECLPNFQEEKVDLIFYNVVPWLAMVILSFRLPGATFHLPSGVFPNRAARAFYPSIQ